MKKFLFVIAVMALMASSFAQGFGGGFGGGQGGGMGRFRMAGAPMTMLLMDPQVAEELKLTDDQKSKLTAAGESIRTEMVQIFQDAGGDREKMQKGMRAVMEKVGKAQMDVLTPEQNKRLKEIYVQDNGAGAIVNKDIQKDLKLSEDQVKKVDALQSGIQAAMQELGRKIGTQEITFQEFQEKNEKNQKILKTELEKLLTEDQKKALKEMEGAKFERKKEDSLR